MATERTNFSTIGNHQKVFICIFFVLKQNRKSSGGPKKNKDEMYEKVSEELKMDSSNFTDCLAEMEKARDEEWEIVDKWAGLL